MAGTQWPQVRATLGAQPWGRDSERDTWHCQPFPGLSPGGCAQRSLGGGLCPRSRTPAKRHVRRRRHSGAVPGGQRWAAGDSWGEPGRGQGPMGEDWGGGLLLGDSGRTQRLAGPEGPEAVGERQGGRGRDRGAGDKDAREVCKRGVWAMAWHPQQHCGVAAGGRAGLELGLYAEAAAGRTPGKLGLKGLCIPGRGSPENRSAQRGHKSRRSGLAWSSEGRSERCPRRARASEEHLKLREKQNIRKEMSSQATPWGKRAH